MMIKDFGLNQPSRMMKFLAWVHCANIDARRTLSAILRFIKTMKINASFQLFSGIIMRAVINTHSSGLDTTPLFHNNLAGFGELVFPSF